MLRIIVLWAARLKVNLHGGRHARHEAVPVVNSIVLTVD